MCSAKRFQELIGIISLCPEPTAGATPSMGFSSTKLDLDGFQATFYDVGGATRLQNIWKNYYSEVCEVSFQFYCVGIDIFFL